MRVSRWVATMLSSVACAAWPQSYTWTDITPPSMTVEDVAPEVFGGNRLIARGFFSDGSQRSAVMYSDDAGRSWSLPAAPLPPYGDSMLVDYSQPGVVYLKVSSGLGVALMGSPAHTGALYRTADFGRTWSTVRTIAIGEEIRPFAVDPQDAHGMYAFYQELVAIPRIGISVEPRNSGTRRTHNDGFDWSAPLATPADYSWYLEGPPPSAPTRLFMGSFNQGTFVSLDSGASWSRFDAPLPSSLTWIKQDPQHANVLYGYSHALENERLLRSDDGGTTWRQIFFSSSAAPRLTIDLSRPNVLWMPYRADTIYRSDDRGETWREVPYPFMSIPAGYIPDATVVTSPAEPGVIYLVRYRRLFRGVPAATPEPVVVEFGYEGNRYWLTSSGGEAVSQDYRQQPGDVKRTGIKWGVWRADDAPAGAAGSCRFWPRPETGLRTRVLVLQGFECDILKRDPGWILEAENEFYAVPPVRGACSNGLIPVRRFNNLQPDLNHRWVVDDKTEALMVERGWYHEGVRMCSRPLGSDEQ